MRKQEDNQHPLTNLMATIADIVMMVLAAPFVGLWYIIKRTVDYFST